MLNDILQGMSLALHFDALLGIVVGVAVGQVLGAIPGLTASMAVALLIPFTFYFDPWVGIPMMLGMFKGSLFGSSMAAILIRTPGAPAAAATVLDGGPMADQGKGGKAMQTALVASVFGDTFSDICLILASGVLAAIAIRFGPGEYVLLIAFSLLTLASLSGKSAWKATVATLLGLVFGAIGLDPMLGSERLTFGQLDLFDGLGLIPVLIGVLAVSEVFMQMRKPLTHLASKTVEFSAKREDNRLSWLEFRRLLPCLTRSSVIGTIVGALPGLGATIAAFLAYNDARNISKTPEKFGKGAIEGVAAPEAANNAVSGSNMIPLLAFGIPGDVAAALILGAFLIQGITPGPVAFHANPVPLYAIFTAMLLANAVNFGIGKAFIPLAKRMVAVPKRLLFPGVLIIASAGAYAIRGSLFDVQLTLVSGAVGYAMLRLGFPPVPMLIGFILTPILEKSLRQTVLVVSAADGWLDYVLSRPVLMVLIVLFAAIAVMMLRKRMQFVRQSTGASGFPADE